MKLLFIHSDYLEYKVTEPVKGIAEDIPNEMKKGRMEEVLAVFTAVEKDDMASLNELIEQVILEVKKSASTLQVKGIALYPYAHLSSELAPPHEAVKVIRAIEERLKADGFEVLRAPFGWYKAFSISCKGHPMSELSREIRILPAEKEKKAIKTREEIVSEIESEYLLLTPDGKELLLYLKNAEKLKKMETLTEHPALLKFILSEEVKGQPSAEPPSIKAMQRLELVDYEAASDSGHFRFYPKGKLIFELLRERADRMARDELGAVEIDTPILYDYTQKDIRGQVQSFHERHYMVHTSDGKEFLLRFAGDFGLFRIMKEATISYRNLPLRVYEFSKSFRYEKRGELSGLKRLRAFHMPDLHVFARDFEQAWEEYQDIYRAFARYADSTGIEYAISFRVVKEFYPKLKDRIVELLRFSGRPAFVEILSQRKHYWVVKHEFQGIDSTGGNCQLSTVQLDVEDAERYGIVYTDEEGNDRGCIILHTSVGSIERWIYTLLEEALKKKKPELPLWLAPTQVRFIPVRDEFIDRCLEMAKALHARADVDDRDEKVGRKIRDAEREWVNLIVVYGEKEMKTDKIPVRFRSGEIRDMTFNQLQDYIDSQCGEHPYRSLPMDIRLSKRVKFRG